MDELLDNEDVRLRTEAHWKENRRLIFFLLFIGFGVSFVPTILSGLLSNFQILTGFPLDYYIAAQGSLIVFLIETFYYAYKMDKIDRKYGFEE
jgi:putative solute:sodium symporter small subunit